MYALQVYKKHFVHKFGQKSPENIKHANQNSKKV